MGSHTENIKLMGNQFEFTACHHDEALCKEAVSAGIKEVKRIESLLTTYSELSFTNKVNEMAGILPVEVPAEMIQLIQRSQKISQLTDGAFDITYGSIDKTLWNFNTTMKSLPDPVKAREATRLVNYRNIIISDSENTVFLKERGMRIGFGGIGKGYAADMAKKVMKNLGVEHGVVNASGDLTAWGHQANGNPWTIGVANPNIKHHIIGRFQIHNGSVATSGDYEKFVVIKGKRYSHTINPLTGLPAEGLKSVTIVAPYAELCDALTTPVIIMGVEAGLHFINQVRGVEVIIIDHNDKIYYSKNINIS
ncbi:MAG: FAD:protein FMN transferase [Saprospiraceae bacterium]|nr:FAD:protein FMN transferase [Saprospiraceae bacterium]MBK8546329.1 FAD:protein FMN transferase [Saprospiraceae bacterium]MBK8820387.1 FAD:protein FMN transferase [Saprospiraceae bacterium]MBK8854367.1 FAD:protein FMN transferase [Saprospiraceae bacterium]